MSDISRLGVALFGLKDIRERHLRFLGGLDELARTSDPAVARVLAYSKQRLLARLGAFSEQATLLLSPFRDDLPGLLKPTTLGRLGALRAREFKALALLQEQVFPYLPLPPETRADLDFYLARSLDVSLTHQRDLFATAHSGYHEWESRAFSHGEAGTVVAVPVPYLETLTPLRWPLLVHELAHYLLPGGLVAGDLIDSVLKNTEHQRLRGALVEIVADMIAEQMCGPAYCWALATEGHLASYQRHLAAGTPTIKQRLGLLQHGSAVLESLPSGWELGPGLPGAEAGSQELDLIAARDLASQVVSAVSEANSSVDAAVIPPAVRRSVVAKARDLMKRGQPAAAVRLRQPPTRQALLNAGSSETKEAVISELFEAAGELACTDAEILLAAWEEEVESAPGAVLTELLKPLHQSSTSEPNEKAIRAELGKLAKRDTWLSRSLQSAAVHRWLVQYDAKIADNALAGDSDDLAPSSLTVEPEPDHPSAVPSEASSSAETELDEPSAPLADLQLLRRFTLPTKDQRRLVISPLIDPSQIGGTTVDLRLGTEWESLRTNRFQALDPGGPPQEIRNLLDASVDEFRLTAGQSQGLVLHPGELLLALSLEYLSLPSDLWGNLEGRSTWARIGLQVHATAGMVDAGFEGYLTFELQNTGRLPLVLYPGLRVGQMALFPVRGIGRPYQKKTGAAYSDQASARSAFPAQHEHQAISNYRDRDESRFQRRRDMKTTNNAVNQLPPNEAL